jgi:hypothetical protein
MAEECVALCDYVGTDGELSFRKGEVITVLAKGTDSGFWEGCSAGNARRGLFPNCMVTSNLNVPRCAKVFLNKAVALFDYAGRAPQEMTFAKHDLITAVRPADNAGWWWGVNETQRRAAGLSRAPTNATTLAASYFDAATASAADKEEWLRLFPTNFVNCNVVAATYPFQARQRHELTLAVGDVVLVHRRWNDGWWEGSLPVAAGGGPAPIATSGEPPIVVGGRRRGMFPSNYTLPNVPTTKPALFCAKCRSVFSASAISGDCRECNRTEQIVRTMMRTLQERDDADGPVDLFEHVDLDPRRGPGALLSANDVRDQTVRPRSTA